MESRLTAGATASGTAAAGATGARQRRQHHEHLIGEHFSCSSIILSLSFLSGSHAGEREQRGQRRQQRAGAKATGQGRTRRNSAGMYENNDNQREQGGSEQRRRREGATGWTTAAERSGGAQGSGGRRCRVASSSLSARAEHFTDALYTREVRRGHGVGQEDVVECRVERCSSGGHESGGGADEARRACFLCCWSR